MADIKAIIEVFADNPPSILIALGFLCVLVGAGFHAMKYYDVSTVLYGFGAAGIVIGTILQIWWLERK